MKEFFVTIGGKERRLRYTPRDAIELYKAFQKPLSHLVRLDVLGGFDAKNNSLGDYRPDAQVLFLRVGLAHDIPQLTEDRVLDWIETHLLASGNIWDLVWPAAKAAYYSGIVLGRSVNLEADEGKAQTTPSSAAPTIPAAE